MQTSGANAASAVLPTPTAQAELMARATVQAATTAEVATQVATPFEATIEPAIGSSAFAPALGARIALLARDGIEQARLNVHPADMGPITVQLALEGSQVRVDFSAELAGTRQTLEEALPSLAASLREAGFTLSGGGVSQQTAQGGNQANSNGGGSASGSAANGLATPKDGADAVAAASARARVGQEAGLVDLYA